MYVLQQYAGTAESAPNMPRKEGFKRDGRCKPNSAGRPRLTSQVIVSSPVTLQRYALPFPPRRPTPRGYRTLPRTCMLSSMLASFRSGKPVDGKRNPFRSSNIYGRMDR